MPFDPGKKLMFSLEQTRNFCQQTFRVAKHTAIFSAERTISITETAPIGIARDRYYPGAPTESACHCGSRFEPGNTG